MDSAQVSTLKSAASKFIRYATIDLLRRPRQAARFWRRLIWVAGTYCDLERQFRTFVPPPRVKLEQLFPGIDTESVELSLQGWMEGEISGYELLLICSLTKRLRPAVVFEFGTFLGKTAYHLARSNQKATVYTLDLDSVKPAAQFFPERDLSLAQYSIANREHRQYHNTPQTSRIEELFGDSLTFDFSKYKGLADLVFIDGAHDYQHVRKDTESAFFMLSPNGIILWHDYDWPDVWRVVQEFAGTGCGEIYELDGTRLALFLPGPLSRDLNSSKP